jgi:hypothetical protein
MKNNSIIFSGLVLIIFMMIFNGISVLLLSPLALLLMAHCDTMDGPLIKDAQKALESKSISPVLKWIKEEDEEEITKMFEQVLAFSLKNPELTKMLEMYFLETVTRVHRKDEGASYIGLKPAGYPIDPIIKKGDLSLETGSAEEVAELLSKEIKKEILKRFEKALKLKNKADEDPDIGRHYIEAYADYIHLIEHLHKLLKSPSEHHSKKHAH